MSKFQHTAARRRLGFLSKIAESVFEFQHTAARRRLAAYSIPALSNNEVSTHSRPKAAGFGFFRRADIMRVSTHSRPKAAGGSIIITLEHRHGFNTQPPEGGWYCVMRYCLICSRFQHTAARRRLAIRHTPHRPRDVSTHSRPKAAGGANDYYKTKAAVSTHSRPKAAGRSLGRIDINRYRSFNTQPPEGGWLLKQHLQKETGRFQHTAARRRLAKTL